MDGGGGNNGFRQGCGRISAEVCEGRTKIWMVYGQ